MCFDIKVTKLRLMDTMRKYGAIPTDWRHFLDELEAPAAAKPSRPLCDGCQYLPHDCDGTDVDYPDCYVDAKPVKDYRCEECKELTKPRPGDLPAVPNNDGAVKESE